MNKTPLHPLLLRGQDALRQNNLDVALQCADQRLAEEPRDASAIELRYLVQIRRNEIKEAIESLRQIVDINPVALWAAEELTVLLFESGQLWESEEAARHAMRLNPLRPQAHNILGMILSAQNKLMAGEWHYRRTMELAAAHPKLLANLALNLQQQGRLEESEKYYQEAARLEPDNPATLVNWARLCEIQGRLDEAHVLLDKAEKNLELVGGDVGLARATVLSRESRFEEALDALQRSRTNKSDAPLMPMRQLERGRLYDRLGRFGEAWADISEAKSRLADDPHMTYDPKQIEEFFYRLRSFFIREHLDLIPKNPAREGTPQPIFILGFPRSGTTMIEQVLNNHSKVHAGDELTYIPDLTYITPKIVSSPYDFPESLAELWMADKHFGMQVFRDYYLGRAEQNGLFKSGKPFFTDKLPLNETYLLFIHMIFPEAKFVHLIRHPLDVGVSVMSNYLTHGFHCGFKIEHFAHHFVAVHDLVAHYLTQAKLSYYPLRYETFVHDQRHQTEKLLNFLGLPFEEACISFHESTRYANTASYAQVTQKLHDRSIGRYKHYLEFLQPTLPVLSPVIAKLGYEI